MSSKEGFDPNRSQVADDRLAEFLANDISPDLASVPGIGPANEKALRASVEGDSGVTTTYQLIGKYLSLRGENMTSKEHCDAFWYYLQARGVSSHRAGIVLSIAERVNIMIPGLYVWNESSSSKKQKS